MTFLLLFMLQSAIIDFNFFFSLQCCRTRLTLNDLMPENPKTYDKMRPPKKEGQATTVYFHVTVMGLDSIDETSMVRKFFFF